jgi:hypothetical protein
VRLTAGFRPRHLVGGVVAVWLMSFAPAVHAYPQFQLSTGTDRCSACHFSPAGGGLLNDYGRSEAGDTISRGGDGAFLHGAWEPPGWFQIGGDYRGAGAWKHVGDQTEWLGFPMQADLYLRAAAKGVSLNVTVGLRGGAREPQPPLIERFTSREHYLMYERESGFYARAGRFFPVFGIRSQDHTAYVRRYLGQHTLEEPYAASVGMFRGAWEAHLTAFMGGPDLLQAGPRPAGAAIYHERRLADDSMAIAAQAKVAVTDADRIYTAGTVGKWWIDCRKLMLLAELDVQLQTFTGPGSHRLQTAMYLGATRTLTRGLLLGGAVQRWQPDTSVKSSREAIELNLQYFFRAHWELHLLGRLDAQGRNYSQPGALALLQLHYYL